MDITGYVPSAWKRFLTRSSILEGARGLLHITARLRLLTCRNGLLAVKNRQVRARWTVVGRIAEYVTPLHDRSSLVSLPRKDHAEHVPGVELLRLQAQRGEHFLLPFGEHLPPLVNQAEIKRAR